MFDEFYSTKIGKNMTVKSYARSDVVGETHVMLNNVIISTIKDLDIKADYMPDIHGYQENNLLKMHNEVVAYFIETKN